MATQGAALKTLANLFVGDKKADEYKVVMAVDAITARGTDEEVLDAFELIPAQKYYGLPRMLLLRRLWQQGSGFIESAEYQARFERLRLLNIEYRKMAHQFGEQAVIEFLKPAALRQVA